MLNTDITNPYDEADVTILDIGETGSVTINKEIREAGGDNASAWRQTCRLRLGLMIM